MSTWMSLIVFNNNANSVSCIPLFIMLNDIDIQCNNPVYNFYTKCHPISNGNSCSHPMPLPAIMVSATNLDTIAVPCFQCWCQSNAKTKAHKRNCVFGMLVVFERYKKTFLWQWSLWITRFCSARTLEKWTEVHKLCREKPASICFCKISFATRMFNSSILQFTTLPYSHHHSQSDILFWKSQLWYYSKMPWSTWLHIQGRYLKETFWMIWQLCSICQNISSAG